MLFIGGTEGEAQLLKYTKGEGLSSYGDDGNHNNIINNNNNSNNKKKMCILHVVIVVIVLVNTTCLPAKESHFHVNNHCMGLDSEILHITKLQECTKLKCQRIRSTHFLQQTLSF